MKRALFILFILGSFIHSTAQVSGYLGNRFYVGYDQGFGFSNLTGSLSVPGNPGITTWFQPSINYVVNNHSTIGLSYTMGMFNYYRESSSSQTFPEKQRYRTHNIAFDRKIFSKDRNALAPVGNYFSYGFAVQFFSLRGYINTEEDAGGPPVYALDTYRGNDFSVYVGWGRQYVFAKRLLLNLNATLNLSLLSVYRINDPEATQIANDAHFRNTLNQVFRFHIGLGVLLF